MGLVDWIVVIIGIFMVMMIYTLLTAPIIDKMIPEINKTIVADEQRIYHNIVNALNIIPWIFIAGLLLFGFVSSQRREPDTGVARFD